MDLCKCFLIYKGDCFEGIVYVVGNLGMFVFDGVFVWFECYNCSCYDEGDYVIFVGEVECCGVCVVMEMVLLFVFYGGGFYGFILF